MITNKRIDKIMKVDERIKGIKVYVDGRSVEIQEKLFSLGAEWFGANTQKIKNEDFPFLYISHYGVIDSGTLMNEFCNNRFKEVKADEVLSWEPEKEEQKFEPYQKVLVRLGDGKVWFADLFAFMNSKYDLSKYVCVGGHWDQCIPYEGNEHLLGTTDEPQGWR